MDDLDEIALLRDLRPQEPLPAVRDLAFAHQVLLDEIRFSNTITTPADQVRSASRLSYRRWALAGGLLAAAATAIALVLPTGPNGVGTQPAAADPVTVLNAAAAAASAAPNVVPRADQFYYIKSRGGGELWLSMDGTHDGLARQKAGDPATVIPGCRNGRQLVEGNYAGKRNQPCTPDPAYLSDVPTTEVAALAYLTRRFGTPGADNANRFGKGIMQILGYTYLRPAARAAVFEAIADTPGLHLTASTTDEHTIAVTWSGVGPDYHPESKEATTLFFNRDTHVFRGVETIGMNGEIGQGSVLAYGIVDHVGERP